MSNILTVKMNENDVCFFFLIFSINFQLPYHMLQGQVITFALKLSHCLRDKLALLTRLPQKRHGPDPSCSHTIRPHLTQLEISLCFVAWHSQECLPVGKKIFTCMYNKSYLYNKNMWNILMNKLINLLKICFIFSISLLSLKSSHHFLTC